MLLIICVNRFLHIGSHFSLRKWWWRPHFPTKLAAAASFSYKIGGGGKDLATLLAAVLTWSGYWEMPSTNLEKRYTSPYRSFNFQQLFFYDIFLRNAYFTSYRSSKYTSTVNWFFLLIFWHNIKKKIIFE